MWPKFNILVAEDDADERELLLLALQHKADNSIAIKAVNDGVEAVEYLDGHGIFSNREKFPFPDLFLLDLKMPRMDGLQVLRWIRAHNDLSALATVVLSASDLPKDVLEAYRLGANAYFQKPGKFNEFTRMLTLMTDYWMLAQQPSSDPGNYPRLQGNERAEEFGV